MADAKISALPSATLPLAGTELVPVVQGGITESVPAAAFGANSNISQEMQRFFAVRPFMAIVPSWASATTTALGTGVSAPTYAAVTPATTNYFTRQRRVAFSTAATASSAALIQPTFRVSRVDGFIFASRFGIATTVATLQVLVGLVETLPGGGVNPSGRTNAIFVGKDNSDTNLQIMFNDGSGSCTKVDTGFPGNTTATDYYEAVIVCQPNGNASVKVTRLNTGDVFSYDATTDLPTAANFLTPAIVLSNGATAAAATINFSGLHAQSSI